MPLLSPKMQRALSRLDFADVPALGILADHAEETGAADVLTLRATYDRLSIFASAPVALVKELNLHKTARGVWRDRTTHPGNTPRVVHLVQRERMLCDGSLLAPFAHLTAADQRFLLALPSADQGYSLAQLNAQRWAPENALTVTDWAAPGEHARHVWTVRLEAPNGRTVYLHAQRFGYLQRLAPAARWWTNAYVGGPCLATLPHVAPWTFAIVPMSEGKHRAL